MVCVTVAERSVEACGAALQGLAFAEVRMDAVDMTVRDVARLFTGRIDLIATCRPGRLSDPERKDLLMAAIGEGAAYVDVEIESEQGMRDDIIRKARSKGCKVIVSFHNYDETPEREELKRIEARCFDAGADIVKIACMARSTGDNARLLGLLDGGRPLVVIGMGAMGSVTRIMAPLLGSPFTYGARESGREVVEGQLDRRTIEEHLASLAAITAGTRRERRG
jgi:3-dehydroquinate dehydratase I